MVPVIDNNNNKPMMPCSEKRARKLMTCGQAKAYWQKGIFCVRLEKEPSAREYQVVALGIDPGSKREGYTVATEKYVVLNITTDTPYWIKEKIATRYSFRKARRYRKTPYRKCRLNRKAQWKKRVPPSTKARWDAKLNSIKQLKRILPITIINLEDIKATTKKDKQFWNESFSPLEIGKKYFEDQINTFNLHFIKTRGFETKAARDIRGFTKLTGKSKMLYLWEAHNVDSHVLCEIALNKTLDTFKGMYQVNYLQFHRRQLHVHNPIKGNFRKQYGTTISLGMSRGSVLKYKNNFYYLGGNARGYVSIHNIETGKRVSKKVKTKDISILHKAKRRAFFIKGK